MTLGTRLAAKRKERGLTQEQLAEMLNVTRQAVSKWEGDAAYPETEKLIRLSELYGCTLDSLIRGEETDALETVQPPEEKPAKEDSLPTLLRSIFRDRKSKRTIRGLPLWHFGMHARGVIAIGPDAYGVLAIGLMARGVFPVGLLALGLFPFGTVAAGLIASGALAVGLAAFGAVCAGVISAGCISFGILLWRDCDRGFFHRRTCHRQVCRAGRPRAGNGRAGAERGGRKAAFLYRRAEFAAAGERARGAG